MRVSILIPAYNVEKYLPICLDSVLGQTYQDLQVVIIDDGSKDRTLEICRAYSEKDSRVEYYSQENQGVAGTRNHLLEKVKGDYVLFVDADDWIELDMVEHLVSLATKYSAGMIMCDRVINDTNPVETSPNTKILSQDEAVKDFLMHEYFVGSLWNKLIHNSLLKDIKFCNEISYGEDALFVWSVLQGVDRVVVSSKQLYHYRMNEDSISHQSFGEKKMTGHLTWQIITGDVRRLWPRFLDVAMGTFALQDMYLLRAASQSSYPNNDWVRTIQKNVRCNIFKVLNTRKLNLKDKVYICIIGYCYKFGKLYYKLFYLRKYLGC